MRKVVCCKYQEELEGLSQPPYPTKKGELIFNSVSKKAWDEWQIEQTKLINEHALNMFDANSRELVNTKMFAFLNLPKEQA